MTFLKKFVQKAANVVKDVGKGIAKAKNVLLPVAGAVVGLALPGVGGVIGGAISKVGSKASGAISKVAEITGIGDGKPGILGIGDAQPGILGIGTGKAALKALQKLTESDKENIKSAEVKLAAGTELTLPEKLALQKKAQLDQDDHGGLPAWVKVAGGVALAAAFL